MADAKKITMDEERIKENNEKLDKYIDEFLKLDKNIQKI